MRARISTALLLLALAALATGFAAERRREAGRLEALRAQLEHERVERWRRLMETPLINWGPEGAAGALAGPGGPDERARRCRAMADRARAEAEEAAARARYFEARATEHERLAEGEGPPAPPPIAREDE